MAHKKTHHEHHKQHEKHKPHHHYTTKQKIKILRKTIHNLKHPPVPSHPKHPKHPKHHGGGRGAIAPAHGHDWILAMNDQLDTCVIAAVANSLYQKTGTWVPDKELVPFGEDISISRCFDMIMDSGLGGHELYSASLVNWPSSGSVMGMRIPEGPHAALYLGGGIMASWGGAVAIHGVIEEIWDLEWR